MYPFRSVVPCCLCFWWSWEVCDWHYQKVVAVVNMTPKAGWCGHTSIVHGALVGLGVHAEVPVRARAGQGTSQVQGSRQNCTGWWLAASWRTVICVLWRMVLGRAREHCKSCEETAPWTPATVGLFVTFLLDLPVKNFRGPCVWQHAISCWIVCWVSPWVEGGCREECDWVGIQEPVSQPGVQAVLLPYSWIWFVFSCRCQWVKSSICRKLGWHFPDPLPPFHRLLQRGPRGWSR